MSQKFPQYPKTNFPNSLDNYIVFTDVNASNKPFVDLYYSKFNANDFAGAAQVLADHPDLKYVIMNADTLQTVYDALMALEVTYSTDVIATIGTCVKQRGEYDNATNYVLFNIVTYNGKAYMCSSPNCPVGTLPTNSTYWTLMTIQGISGTGMAFYPTWSKDINFKLQDCLPYGNKLYVAVRENLNKIPSDSPDDWKSVITVPKQIIYSINQPENQEAGDVWYQINSVDASCKMMVKQADGSYSQKHVVSNASFVKTTSGNTVQNHIDDTTAHVTQLACVKTGTVYALTGTLPAIGRISCIFPTPAIVDNGTYKAGDTFTVNDEVYAISTVNNIPLSDKAFEAAKVVPCIISPQYKSISFENMVRTAKDIGAVVGNTASWVATSAIVSDPWSQTLTIPNFIFTEGCQVTFKAAQVPKDDSVPDGTRVIINGKGYCFSTTTRETLSHDAWVVGAAITVTLSNDPPLGWGASNGCGTAFFKGGSSSAGSIYTASAPNNPKVGTIWIDSSGIQKFWNGSTWQNIAAVWG